MIPVYFSSILRDMLYNFKNEIMPIALPRLYPAPAPLRVDQI